MAGFEPALAYVLRISAHIAITSESRVFSVSLHSPSLYLVNNVITIFKPMQSIPANKPPKRHLTAIGTPKHIEAIVGHHSCIF